MQINVMDVVIAYETLGSGPPIVLLHGWGANRYTFVKLMKHLSNDYQVYALDLPGFGDSQIGVPFSVYEVSEIINEFCKKLSITNPILLGHSYGGRIAIIYAARYKVKKLILVSSAGVKTKLTFNKRLQVRAYKLLKKLHIKVRLGSSDYLNSDNVKRKMLVNAVNTDLCEEMKKIECDTLLIYGKCDEETKIESANIIKSNIKNSALIVLDDCRHFPYLEQPTIFNLILDSFLAGEKD